MTPSDALRTDALERLKTLRDFLDAMTASSLGEAYETFDECVAAWKKEREHSKVFVETIVIQGDEIAALKSAIERVEKEMRQYAYDEYGGVNDPQTAAWADALKSAREGA